MHYRVACISPHKKIIVSVLMGKIGGIEHVTAGHEYFGGNKETGAKRETLELAAADRPVSNDRKDCIPEIANNVFEWTPMRR